MMAYSDLDWMEQNRHLAVTGDMTIVMKHTGSDIMLHGLFVDTSVHNITTCDERRHMFMILYQKNFDSTGRGHI
jgi:hypothetical protein